MNAQDTAGLVAELLDLITDWDGSRIADGSLPRVEIYCGTLRRAADALTAKDSDLAEARAALRCVQQQCETAVYNITQREHDEAVVRSFQNIADFCARTVLSREKEASSNE